MLAQGSIYQRHTRENLFRREECAEILQNILGDNKKAKLLEFNAVPELGTIGYLGEYFHLYLKYKLLGIDGNVEGDERETRVFVKTMPYVNQDLSLFIEKSGILKKEATLYKTLLNELRKLSSTTWCAQCYYVRKDLFVMQNITDLGYEPLADSSVFLTQYHIKAMLKGLAVMHASSIAYEVRNQVNIGEKLKDVLYEVTVSPSVDWYTVGLRAISAVALRHPLYQSIEHQEFIKNQLPKHFEIVYQMVNPSTEYRNVFCHRDSWGGNAFFDDKDSSKAAVFVDFQLCRYCPPAIDVLMVLYLNLIPQERRPVMPELCKFYYDAFSRELVEMGFDARDHLPWEQFEKSIKDFELFAALYNSLTATILRVPGDYLKNMKQQRPEDFHRYANVDRTNEVLSLLDSSAEFKTYLHACVQDMMETALRRKL